MALNQLLKSKFESEYQKLNSQQRQAVDTIEGPVMVIAGAGTGKTQTIALRIANILDKTQTSPGSILCLTFTENAAANMRQRLLSIIGSAAYSVRIHTFHSFCNEVILTNPQYFIFAANIQPLEELEKIEIIQNLIENLAHNSPLKPWGDPFYYQREIISRIQTLKRENVTPDKMNLLIKDQQYFVDQSKDLIEQLRSLRANKEIESQVLAVFDQIKNIPNLSISFAGYLHLYETLYSQNHFADGQAKTPAVNFKNELIKFFDNLVKSIPKQTELSLIYQEYQDELKNRGRYDFDDMILFVLNAFEKNPDLLLSYQERFQYILVDEYQDTNSAQNRIIEQLGSYFDIPNIFVVGDDDQSIFRFQGAAIENIFTFIQKHQSHLQKIVLLNNYRSHQLILDSSDSVISHNKTRITNLFPDITKKLTATKTYDPDPINLFAAPSILTENYFVATKIHDLIQKGVDPGEIAVLYRANSDSLDLQEMLSNMNIPYHLETGLDVLSNSYIRQIFNLLSLINNPSDDNLLFKVLTYPFLKISQVDLFKIVRYSQRQDVSFADLINLEGNLDPISDSLKPITLRRLRNFRIRMAKSRRWSQIFPLEKLFNRVIRKFKFLDYLLSLEDVEQLNCLNDLYSYLKTLSQEKNFDLGQFLNRINLLIQNDLGLPLTSDNGDHQSQVRLMTVHKAKGLEFDHVFLLKVTDRKWGNNLITQSLQLPLGILKTELLSQDENEEERRLFYVALTRAKKQIYITYSTQSASAREQLPSMFIHEIDPQYIEIVKSDSKLSHDAIVSLFPKIQTSVAPDTQYQKFLRHYLSKEYLFNVSHLNSYIKCPLCFYYKTILRIPASKDKFASLGTAVHWALSFLFNKLREDNHLISKEEFLKIFQLRLTKENLSQKYFDETLARGTDTLSQYYDFYKDQFSCNCIIDFDFKHDHVYLDQIPITGKIDKIELLDSKTNGRQNANVVDFKTGNPDSKGSEMKLGSDYYRQLVFYKILADRDPHFKYHLVSGTIDFVQKSKIRNTFVKKDYQISPDDETEIINLIKDIYQKILSLEFPPSPDCDDRDDLHRLAK